jgi:hypothetical protein
MKAGILILIMLAAGGAYVYGSNLATASFSPSVETTSQSQSSLVTLSSQSTIDSQSSGQTDSSTTSTSISTSSGGSLVIAVSKTISDQPEAQKGDSVYIYDVSIEDTGQDSYPVNQSLFTMVSVSGADYSTVSVSAIQMSLPSHSMIAPGQVTSGQIAFQFSSSQTPAELEYVVPGALNETVRNLPSPSAFVSEPNPWVEVNVNYAVDVTGYQDLYTYQYIQNNTLFFYTGQVIAIVVPLADVNIGSTVTVYSVVSATPGLSVVRMSLSFPISVVGTSGGIQTDLIVDVLAPPTSFTGAITLNLTANEDCC